MGTAHAIGTAALVVIMSAAQAMPATAVQPGCQERSDLGMKDVVVGAPTIFLAQPGVDKYRLVRCHAFSPWDLALAVAWLPDQHFLLASKGEKIVLMSVPELAPVWELQVGALTPSLDFENGGHYFAAGSRDGYLRVWALPADPQVTPTILPKHTILAHRKGVNQAAFSPDGALIMSAGNDAVARIWLLDTAELIREMVGGAYAIPSVAYQHKEHILAILNGDTIRLREIEEGRIVGTLKAETVFYSAAFSPGDDLLAVGDINNRVYLFDPARAFKTASPEYPQPLVLEGHVGKPGSYHALIWDIAFRPDGKLLASAGGDGQIALWSLPRGDLATILEGHQRAVTSVAFSKDGHWLASAGLDGAICLWAEVLE